MYISYDTYMYTLFSLLNIKYRLQCNILYIVIIMYVISYLHVNMIIVITMFSQWWSRISVGEGNQNNIIICIYIM